MSNHSDKARDAEDKRAWSAWCRANRLQPTESRTRKHRGTRVSRPAGKPQTSPPGLTSKDEAVWQTAVTSGFEGPQDQPTRQPPVRTRQTYGKISRLPRPAGPEAPLQLERRIREKLRAGKLSPASVIDLHGQTLEMARRATHRFVASSRQAELRLVLVITGKGRRSRHDWQREDNAGILRKAMPDILASRQLRPHVQYFQSAHGRHGGSGAFYVWLRRQRK